MCRDRLGDVRARTGYGSHTHRRPAGTYVSIQSTCWFLEEEEEEEDDKSNKPTAHVPGPYPVEMEKREPVVVRGSCTRAVQ